MRRIWASIAFLFVFCFSTVALAAEVAPDVDGTVDQVVKAASAGQWLLAVAGVLTLVMFALRNWRERIKIFRGDRGGALLVILLSVLGSVSTFLASGNGFSFSAIAGALAVAFTSAGGYTTLRRIIWPQDSATAPSEDVATEQ